MLCALLGVALICGNLLATVPQLKRNQHGALQLIVNDKPYIMLAGELLNSSSSTAINMEPRWKRLKDLNLNTVLMSVTWEMIEPEEGEFDFAIVESLIKEARKHDLKIVFLWFGSWKNGSSGYAPHWVIRDTARFPRMRNREGHIRDVLSFFSEEVLKADMRAYTELMRFIKKIDAKENTVLMMQIQNEVGLLGDSRDRSITAEKLFAENAPEKLFAHLQKNKENILPEIREQWGKSGFKTKTPWGKAFGNDSKNLADEMFMAWHYASFIDKMASAGKKIHPLPVFANAWIIWPDQKPGDYPSGGPNARMLDVWQAAAPSVDILAVDNYHQTPAAYAAKSKEYMRSGNPLFVPEAVSLWTGDELSGPAKAYWSLAEGNAICFAPFAIDHPVYSENHPLKTAYAMLQGLIPTIAKAQGSDDMFGFMQKDKDHKEDIADFDDYRIYVRYFGPNPGYGLVIRLSEDEFLLSGNGISAHIVSKKPGLEGIGYGLMREGRFNAKGEWITERFLGGDEGGLRMPAVYLGKDVNEHLIKTIRVKVYPVEKSAAHDKDVFDIIKN